MNINSKFFAHICFLMAIKYSRSLIDCILKLKLRFSKCTVIMGRDHGQPYNTKYYRTYLQRRYDSGRHPHKNAINAQRNANSTEKNNIVELQSLSRGLVSTVQL